MKNMVYIQSSLGQAFTVLGISPTIGVYAWVSTITITATGH